MQQKNVVTGNRARRALSGAAPAALLLILALVVAVGTSAAPAQESRKAPPGGSPRPSSSGSPFGKNPLFNQPSGGGGPGLTLTPAAASTGGTAMTATDRYVFVLRGNTLYQFDVNGLKLLAQTQLPAPAPTPRPPDLPGNRPAVPDVPARP